MIEKKNKTPFYKINKLYSITINPDDKHQGVIYKPYNRIGYVKKLILDILHDCEYFKMCLNVDISEPKKLNGNYPRIHFHGIFMFTDIHDILNFQLNFLYKVSRFSNIDIDECNDFELWKAYCKKYNKILNINHIKYYFTWKEAGLMSSPEGEPSAPLACLKNKTEQLYDNL